MNFLKNKEGFSLLEITIAMGLAAAGIMFLMKMQAQQAKSQKTAKANMEIDSFVGDLKGTINRPGYCDKSFKNLILKDKSDTPVKAIVNPLGDARYVVGELYGNRSIKLSGLTIKNFRPDDVEGRVGVANLEIALEKVGEVYGAKVVTRQIELTLTRDKSDKILGCGSLSTNETIVIQTSTTEANKVILPKNVDLNSEEAKKVIESNEQFKQMKDTLDSMKKMQEEEMKQSELLNQE